MGLVGNPRGTRIGRPPVRSGSGDWLEELVAAVLVGVWSLLAAGLRLVWRYPFTVAGAALAVTLWERYGPVWLGVVVGVLLLVVLLRLLSPRVWFLLVERPAWRYRKRRAIRRCWRGLCDAVGLAEVRTHHRSEDRTFWTPGLSRLRWTPARGWCSPGGCASSPGRSWKMCRPRRRLWRQRAERGWSGSGHSDPTWPR